MMKKLISLVLLTLMFTYGTVYAQDFWVGSVYNDSLGNFVPNVQNFDWSSSGSGDAQGLPVGTAPTVGTTFTFRYQSSLVALQDPIGNVISFPGLNSGFEYTIVMQMPMQVIAYDPLAKSSVYSTLAGGKFFIYHDAAKNAVVTSGYGFDDGELVASGDIEPNQFISFTLLYANLGVGSAQMNAKVNYSNSAFLVPAITIASFRIEATVNFPPLDSATASFFDGRAGQGNLPAYTVAATDGKFKVDGSSKFGACAGAIGDFVWHDLNRNGLQDAGEPGIDGVTVNVKNSGGTVIATTTTGVGPINQHGYYQFTGLCTGDYTVVVDETTLPGGYTPTTSNVGSDRTVDSNGSPAAVNLPTDNSSDQTIDFGYVSPCTGKIGDFVWHDLNRDGLQGQGEPGIDGIAVALKNSGGTTIATTTTGAGPGGIHGYYQFTGLCAGDYSVEAATPVGFSTTPSAVGSDRTIDSNGSPAPVSLPTDNSSDQTIDFGFITLCTGTIGDYVWLDQNNNSLQDALEPGIDGVTIKLLNASDNSVIATTTTAFNTVHGYYQFSGLCAGDYKVVVTTPSGLTPVPLCSTDQTIGNDSNCSPAPVTLPDDHSSNQKIDFGFESPCTGTIGDFVWEDLNSNGLQDSGEPGINGVTVNLKKASDNSLLATTTTSSGGFYQFSGLCAGSYKVEVVAPSGYMPTTPCSADQTIPNDSSCNPATVELPWNDSSNQTIDFGFVKPACIGDFVWEDLNANGIQDAGEPGINGVAVNLLDCAGNILATTTTANNSAGMPGYYQFCGLFPGDYKVQFVLPSGFVFASQDKGANDAVDSDANPADGTTICTTLTSGENDMTWDAGMYRPVCLGDYVWHDLNANGIQDANEQGIPGVTVVLQDCAGNILATTTTDANGKYTFCGLMPGSYTVKFVAPAGYVFSSQYQGSNSALDSNANPATGKSECVTLVSGQNNYTIDAGLYKPLCLGDFVWNDLNRNGIQDAAEPGISGVTVQLYACNSTVPMATATTDANGFYQFCGLRPGSYQVKFTAPSGYVFSPQYQGVDLTIDSNANASGISDCIILVGTDNYTIDAGMYKNPASIGDFVWNDYNKDGVQNAGEPGIPGVKVDLFTCNGTFVATTTTNSTGYYSFTNLNPGDYYVKFYLPTGYAFSPVNQGTNPALDSDANPSDGRTACTTLEPGENDMTWDAGMYKVAVGCTYTQGYWKNHPEVWPASSLTLGTVTYTKKQLLMIFGEPVKGNGLVSLAHQLIAAKLNQLNGASGTPDVQAAINAADAIIGGSVVPPIGNGYLNPSTTDGLTGIIDAYNNGLAAGGPPHCDEQCIPPTPPPTTCTGQIGNFVWEDMNKDGLQTVGEPGIGGVTLLLKDLTGKTLKTTTSANDGFYMFSGLCGGGYLVEAVAPAGYSATAICSSSPSVGNDSNCSPTTVYLGTDVSSNQTIDFGFVKNNITFQGCTPGYWKNHSSNWPSVYRPTSDFDATFKVNAFNPNINLLNALGLGGGGLSKLARHGTSALLNASDSRLKFPMTVAEVLNAIKNAISSGNYEPLATQLDTYNNLGCPLN